MQYEKLPSFKSDEKSLASEHKVIVEKASEEFIQALKGHDQFHPSLLSGCSRNYRLQLMTGHQGIYEIAWNFKRPALRSTFHIDAIEIDYGTHTEVKDRLIWRRVGLHDQVYTDP